MADKKKNASQSQMAAPKARDGVKEQDEDKSTRAVARERNERKERESRTVARARESNRRENKAPSDFIIRLRSNRIVRFLLEAYYELRYKVTWPTFPEARNMTIVVILLSAVVGVVLGLVDLGLQKLFFFISGIH